MRMFLANILLATTWTALVGNASLGTLIAGFVLGYAILALSQPLLGVSSYFKKVFQIIGFVLFFAYELLKSNLRVAYSVIRRPKAVHSGVIAIPLDAVSDLEITGFANFVTLTPGTLSIDVSEDRQTLYIHTLYAEDAPALRKSIKNGLERKFLEVAR